METQYAIIWFEDGTVYTLTDHLDRLIMLNKAEAVDEEILILRTEDEVDRADDDTRYAIPTDLFSDLFG